MRAIGNGNLLYEKQKIQNANLNKMLIFSVFFRNANCGRPGSKFLY